MMPVPMVVSVPVVVVVLEASGVQGLVGGRGAAGDWPTSPVAIVRRVDARPEERADRGAATGGTRRGA